MSNDPVDGGTVTYHRAEWIGEKVKPIYPWMVHFMEDGPIHELTKAEGEAMGLTPPPAPLVVTCNGHSIEMTDEEAGHIVNGWAYAGRGPLPRLAGLLRDARQDPQPATADSDDRPSTMRPAAADDVIDFVEHLLIEGTADRPGAAADAVRFALLHIEAYRAGRARAPIALVSPAEGLRAVLAGRDDADELIADPSQFARTWMMLVLDAARAARSGGAT